MLNIDKCANEFLSKSTKNIIGALRVGCLSLGDNIQEHVGNRYIHYRIKGTSIDSHFTYFTFGRGESIIIMIRIFNSQKLFILNTEKKNYKLDYPNITMDEFGNLINMCYKASCLEAKRIP